MELRANGVFVVTGGAGALADAIAGVFGGAGARLALIDRAPVQGQSGEALRERAAAHGAVPLVADLTSPAETAAALAEIEGDVGPIEGLIHTAGVFAMAPADTPEAGLYARLFDANVRTLVNATQAVLPGMLARGSGFLAGISSNVVWEGTGAASMSLYAAAKAAVAFYLRSVEREVRGAGVRVAIVYPLAAIDTPANRRAMPEADPAGWVEPIAIAEALLFAATRGPRGRLTELPIGVGK
jgi:NADP-dependent 3-hydroxy acid dehydrogenase YdfG